MAEEVDEILHCQGINFVWIFCLTIYLTEDFCHHRVLFEVLGKLLPHLVNLGEEFCNLHHHGRLLISDVFTLHWLLLMLGELLDVK